jgi:hypothetical protein
VGEAKTIKIDIPLEVTPLEDENGNKNSVVEQYVPYPYSSVNYNLNQVKLQWENNNPKTTQPVIDFQDIDKKETLKTLILPYNSTSALVSSLALGKKYSFNVQQKNDYYTTSGINIGTCFPGPVDFKLSETYSDSIEVDNEGKIAINTESLINNSDELSEDISGFFVGHNKQADPVFIEWGEDNNDKTATLSGFANLLSTEHFWVQSWDKVGNTSIIDFEHTLDTVPPSPVENFQYNLSTGSDPDHFKINLSWTAYSDSLSHYDDSDDVVSLILKGTDNYSKNGISITDNSLSITVPYNLLDNNISEKAYYYEIQAVDNDGNRSIPARIDFNISDFIPYPLSDIDFTLENDCIKLSWATELKSGSTIKIEYGISGNFDINKKTINNITSSPYMIKELSVGVYQIKVYVINRDGISSSPMQTIMSFS